MTVQSSVSSVKSHWGHRITVAVVVLLIATTAVFVTKRPPAATLTVNENLHLRLVGVLSQKSPDFVYKTWQRRLYDATPHWFQREVLSEFGEPVRTVEISAPPQRPGIIGYLFRPHVSGSLGHSPAAAHKAMEDLLGQRDLYLQLDYGDGYHSDPKKIYSAYTELSGTAGAVFGLFGANFDAVPVTVKELDVHLVELTSGEWKFCDTFRMTNPVYDPVQPLVPVSKLPITVSHDGVDVTLAGLFTKAVRPNMSQNKMAEKFDEPDTRPEIIDRAAGHPNDPYTGTAMFKITNKGATSSDWAITSATVFYGQKLLPFAIEGYSIQEWDEADGLYQAISFLDDFGAIQQPVQVSVSLTRRRNFPADEQQVIEMPVSELTDPEGTSHSLEFWNGTAQLSISEHEHIPGSLQMEVAGSSDETLATTLQFNIGYRGKSGEREAYTKESVIAESYTAETNVKIARFRKPSDEEVMLQRGFPTFTTATLTVTSPRKIQNTFDFIATPSDARVPGADTR